MTVIEQRAASEPQASEDAPKRGTLLGLPSATALVIGGIIGTGVFTMPAMMAGAGTMSIVTLGVIAICAVLLGTMFGQLTKQCWSPTCTTSSTYPKTPQARHVDWPNI